MQILYHININIENMVEPFGGIKEERRGVIPSQNYFRFQNKIEFSSEFDSGNLANVEQSKEDLNVRNYFTMIINCLEIRSVGK